MEVFLFLYINDRGGRAFEEGGEEYLYPDDVYFQGYSYGVKYIL